MNTLVLKVTNVKKGGYCRPRIVFYGEWLSEIGFEPDTISTAIPVNDGMDITLCNENISKYNSIVKYAKDNGGKLVTTLLEGCDSKPHFPKFSLTGKNVENAGFNIGDDFVIRYEYGIIKLRKIYREKWGITDDMKTCFMVVGSINDKHMTKRVPKIKFPGHWLSEIGFVWDSLVLAVSEPGKLTFTYQGEGLKRYTELVSFARQNNAKLIQIRKRFTHNQPIPEISITGEFLERAGFGLDDVLLACCRSHTRAVSGGNDQGQDERIEVTKMDFEQLGF